MSFQYQLPAQADSIPKEFSAFSIGNLYEPDPVQFSFETIGWPILGVLLLVTIAIGFYCWRKHVQKNAYRKNALKTLDELKLPEQSLEIFVILKSTAIHAFGREKVGSLVGKDWLRFLDNSGRNVQMLSQEKSILSAIYQSEPIPVEAQKMILSNAKKWIRTHASQL